jgi:U3 small nucleolar RNA-associated protein 5
MMQAQLELRRRNQKRSANDDEDEAVIYVEGEDDYVSSAEGSVDGDTAPGAHKRIRAEVDDDDDESSVDEMPTAMEVNEESAEGSDDSEGLIDDEAEETDGDTGDDMSEPMSDDLEDGADVSESEEESQPARRSTAARTGLTNRR